MNTLFVSTTRLKISSCSETLSTTIPLLPVLTIEFLMECLACKQHRQKRHWSPAQWSASQPVMTAANGEFRNCCNVCSPTFLTSTPSPAAESRPCPSPAAESSCSCNGGGRVTPSLLRRAEYERFHTLKDESIFWLRRNVPCEFWVELSNLFTEANHDIEAMCALRKKLGIENEKKSYRKILSYYGAVRVPEACVGFVEPHWIAHLDPDGTKYLDPCNSIYCRVFECAWPNALRGLGMSNEKTVGDLMEALLGIGWCQRQTKRHVTTMADSVLRHIEDAVFATWVCENYYM